jgi:hypothetical protein
MVAAGPRPAAVPQQHQPRRASAAAGHRQERPKPASASNHGRSSGCR